MTERKRIIVVGGGAAGLMAAVSCGGADNGVYVFERNKTCGRKILITGKGRCNVTNNCDIQTVLDNTPTNPRFLYSALAAFSPCNVMSFFENSGVALKTERGNRVFPRSDRAADIAEALYRRAGDSGCSFVHDRVLGLLSDGGRICGVQTAKNKKYYCDRVILACGGVSYPATGSTGDGYRMAEQVGHTIVPPKPSLVPLTCRGSLCRDMMGLSLRNISISVSDKESGKIIYSDFGELLFTHFGVSGPVVLSASAHLKDPGSGRYRLHIDLKPALSERQLDMRLVREFESNKNKNLATVLRSLLPAKMIPSFISLSGLPGDLKCCLVTKAQRKRMVSVLKSFDTDISGFRPIEEAIVTSGGINTKEINPRTMESRMIEGLYFAGEMIDVDAYTGGFNLQIAFSTGFLAGASAAK